MTCDRRRTLAAGLCYLATFVAIPTLALYEPLRSATGSIESGAAAAARWAAVLEIVVALAGVGTAVALYPVVGRIERATASAFIAARTLEGAMILVGVASMLTLVQMSTGDSPLGPDALATQHQVSVALYDWAFTLGQSLMPGINALLIGSLLWRGRMVPRVIPLIGLVGAPFHLLAVGLTIMGAIDRLSPLTVVGAAPIALWELSLGVYLVAKGLRISSADVVAG
jgi:hypothetical protein